MLPIHQRALAEAEAAEEVMDRPRRCLCPVRLPSSSGTWWYEGPNLFLAEVLQARGGSGAPLHQLERGCWLRPDRCRSSGLHLQLGTGYHPLLTQPKQDAAWWLPEWERASAAMVKTVEQRRDQRQEPVT